MSTQPPPPSFPQQSSWQQGLDAAGPRYVPPAGSGSAGPSGRRPGFGAFAARALTIWALCTVSLLVAVVAPVSLIVAVLAGGTAGSPIDASVSVGGSQGADRWVLVVPVDGVIVNSGVGFGVTGGEEILALLEDAAADDRVAAVVLELSTPGGTIPGAIDVAAGVAAVQDAGKPVVAYVKDLSASGGMWAMAGADRIVAHPGSVVGSIGVIFGPFRQYQGVTSVDDGLFSGGVTAERIDEFYITAGSGKDVGNPFRALTDDERQFLQRDVDRTYDGFVAHVASARGIAASKIRDEFGARVFRSEDAVALGLVDEVAGRRDAWRTAARLAADADADADGGDGADDVLDRFDVRIVPADFGMFSGLLGKGDAGDTSASAAADGPSVGWSGGVAQLCNQTPAAHAFHGDLAAFCASR